MRRQKEKNPNKTKPSDPNQAATIVQRGYRAYLRDKGLFVNKKELVAESLRPADLNPREKSEDSLSTPIVKDQTDNPPEIPLSREERRVPIIKNKQDEVTALFLNVKDPASVIFTQRGYATLFPLGKDKSRRVNLAVLEAYLYKGVDIRPFVLEAYLRNIIHKDTFISLFQIQQGMLEFWPRKTDISQLHPYHLLQIHGKGIPSAETKKILFPYLLKIASPYAATIKNKNEFDKRLKKALLRLPPTANYFTLIDLPTTNLLKITYYLLVYKLESEFNNIDKDIFATKLKHAKEFLTFVAGKLGVPLDVNSEVAHKQLHTLCITLSEVLITQMTSARNNAQLTVDNLLNYMIPRMDFFAYLVLSVDDFLPIVYQENTTLKAAVLIMNCETQAAWLKAITGVDPEDVVVKIPMFDQISVLQLNQMTEQGQRPIGLAYSGIEIPKKVHNTLNKPYAYTSHDLKFHYQVLYFLRAFAEAVYQMQLQFVDAIRKTTQQVKNTAIISILDFTASFYADTFSGEQTRKQQIAGYAFITTNEATGRFALLEYALIVICDMLKNPSKYQKLLDQFPAASKEEEAVPLNYLMQNILQYFGINFEKYISPNKNNIIAASNSLGVFRCMLSIFRFKTEHINKLCEKIAELERDGLAKFKWNEHDGLMLNIGKLSFRFRHPSSDKDARYTRIYKSQDYIRKFSNEPGWWDELVKAVQQPNPSSLKKL